MEVVSDFPKRPTVSVPSELEHHVFSFTCIGGLAHPDPRPAPTWLSFIYSWVFDRICAKPITSPSTLQHCFQPSFLVQSHGLGIGYTGSLLSTNSTSYTQLFVGHLHLDIHGTSILMQPKLNLLSSVHHLPHYHGNIITQFCKSSPLLQAFNQVPHLAMFSYSYVSNLAPSWKPSITTLVQVLIIFHINCWKRFSDLYTLAHQK